MISQFRFLHNFFQNELWNIDVRSMNPTKAFLIKTLRLIYLTVHAFQKGELNLRAMSLVYSTLLALVPLLALSFSVLKAFGVHNQLRDALGRFLIPLGEKGIELTDQIISFVDNIKIGVLSAIGLVALIYTIIMLIQKIEDAVNHIWRIEKPRSLARRFSDYMSVLLTGPVLIFAALGIKALFMSHSFIQKLLTMEPFGTLFFFAGQVLPFVFICLFLTFIIVFIPNTKVKFGSALLGGMISGIIWQLVGWVFSYFVASSTRYVAIYSSFAVLFMFIIWLYINWLILLIGAQVAFCHQNLDYISIKEDVFELSNRLKEKICFAVMYLIGYNFVHDVERLTLTKLAFTLSMPAGPVNTILDQLCDNNILTETNDDPPTFIPSRDVEQIKLIDVLNTVRVGSIMDSGVDKKFDNLNMVNEVTTKVENSIGQSLSEMTLKGFVQSAPDEIRGKTSS